MRHYCINAACLVMVAVVSVACQTFSVDNCSACGRVAWQHIVQNVCFAAES